MDILKSIEKQKTCLARILAFSGRPDPTWDVGINTIKKLKSTWEALPPWSGKIPVPPPLGYRGCILSCEPGVEFFVYREFVKVTYQKNIVEKLDKDEKFEKLLISSAPEGLIPDAIMK